MEQTKKEIYGGITTFLTMSYIIIVNPAILSTEGTGMPFSGVLTGTILISFLATLLMGLYAKLPYGLAPGMGLNTFFTFAVIIGEKVPWQTALGMVFWSGIIFLLISVTPMRAKLMKSIPPNLRVGMAVGIGLFLTFIGFKNAGVIVSDPQTFVGSGDLLGTPTIVILGIFMTLYLVKKKNPLAFIIGMAFVFFISILMGEGHLPKVYFSMPDFSSVFFKLDIWGALKWSLFPSIITLMLTDLFDTMSTFVGVSERAKLLDEEGHPKNLNEGLIVDSIATICSGFFGTSSTTTFIESISGIEIGARGRLSAVVCAFCFLPFLFLSPLLSAIPSYVTAPALIVVGCLMFQGIKDLDFRDLEDVFPAFLVIILIPWTFSITNGILWGFIAHVTLYLMFGRYKEISKTLYSLAFVSLFFVFYLNR